MLYGRVAALMQSLGIQALSKVWYIREQKKKRFFDLLAFAIHATVHLKDA